MKTAVETLACGLAVGLLSASFDVCACDGFVVGKRASRTGRVIVAHNEDNYLTLNVRHAFLPAGAPLFDEPGRSRIPQVEKTYGCFWSELKSVTANQYPGDVFLNENGVMVYSNNGGVCRSYEGQAWELPDEGPYSTCTDGGLGINLRFAVAQRARTAREGVAIMTELIDRWGYEPLSRIFTIADKDEAWLVQVIHRRRYVARRCPDDEVAAYPNCLTIGRIRSGDICSSNILARGSDFDFAKTYQGPRGWKAPNNVRRGTDLYRIVAGTEAPTDDGEYPFSMRPAHSVSADDIKRGLRSHYEGTAYEVCPRHPDEDRPTFSPICRLSTLEALVCEFGRTPADLVLHLATGRPCETPYAVGRIFAGEWPGDAVFGNAAVARLKDYRRLPTASGLGWNLDPASWRLEGDGLVSRANLGTGGFAVAIERYARKIRIKATVRPMEVGMQPARLGVAIYDNPEEFISLDLVKTDGGRAVCALTQRGTCRLSQSGDGVWNPGIDYGMELMWSDRQLVGRVIVRETGAVLYSCACEMDDAMLAAGGYAALRVSGDFTGWIEDVRVETSDEMPRAECPLSRCAANGALNLGMGKRLCQRADEWSILPYRGRDMGFFPDVFHPQFAESCDWLARELCTVHRKDRTLTGYYLDDGIRWPTLDEVLQLDEAHPARRAAVAFVGGREVTDHVRDGFLELVSRTYLMTLSSAVRRHDPRHPILGLRAP